MDIIITGQTAADTGSFTSSGPFTLLADGLVGSEEVAIKRTGPSGVATTAYNRRESVVLTSALNTVPIYTAGEIAWTVEKPVTAGLVSVGVTGDVTV